MTPAELTAGLARCRVAGQVIAALEASPAHHRAVCDAPLPMPDASAPVAAAVWVQVATAGDYKGYAGGAFVFDAGVFAQIVANFRAHPSFVPGGGADVIPWDFNHASAAFAGDGTIPLTGTPAQGWVRDVAVRLGADGTAQLWALTRWLEPARSYILEGRYQWASVVVGFDCRDPESGANIGAVLESIALTNNPFIEGMQRLAASREGVPSQQQGPNTMQPKLTLTLPRGVAPGSAVAGQLAQAVVALAARGSATNTADIDAGGIPDWRGPAQDDLWGLLTARAMRAGVGQNNAARWLAQQPEAAGLALDLADRLNILSNYLLRLMRVGSVPNGTDLPPVDVAGLTKLAPLNASNAQGRNPTERAVLALRGHSPRFAGLPFGEQIEQASAALRTGLVVA